MTRLRQAYVVLCLGLLGLNLGSRALYFAWPSPPAVIAAALAIPMRLNVQYVPLQTQLEFVELAACVVALFVGIRRGILLPRGGPGAPRRLKGWVLAFILTLLVWHNYLLDADPMVAGLCAVTLAAAAVGLVSWPARVVSRWRRRVAMAAVAACCLLAFTTAPTFPVAVAIATWSCVMALAILVSVRWLHPLHALLCTLPFAPLCGFVLAGGLPLFNTEWIDGKPEIVETAGYAYGYCEVPGTTKLLMTIPVGETDDLGKLREGFVAEHDLATGERREYSLFSGAFFGGLRMIYCLKDGTVQITMNSAVIGGRRSRSNVLEFPASNPTALKPSIFDEAQRRADAPDVLGHAAVYDEQRDAMFYVSEWTNKVHRLDRRTGELDTRVGDILPPKTMRFGNYGPQTGATAIHPIRRTIYLSEWVDGSTIYEIDVDRIRVVRRFDTHDTGSFGLTVDVEKDRLFASGLWGINVIDLDSGRLLARVRTGPGPRAAIVDTRRDLVYVPSTLGGHVWVFDRNGLDVLGRLAVGVGGRPGYLTRDGRYLFVSNQAGVLRWDAERVARRFRR